MLAVCLLSGGIDSPVAAYLLAERGAEVVLLHMDNRPYTTEGSMDKVSALRERLEDALGREMRLLVAPHGASQEAFSGGRINPYQCVMCKRTMLHVAKEAALKLHGEAIITGESLGQVASQTLHNLKVESYGLDFPVLRPLIGLDKIEIENLAKKIGTYEISIGTSSPCNIVPKHPITMCSLEEMLEQQAKVDFSCLVKNSADHAVEIKSHRKGSN